MAKKYKVTQEVLCILVYAGFCEVNNFSLAM